MNLNMIHSMIKSENISKSGSLTFKAGQIFQGSVIKLYKDDIAQIQVGTMKLIAKLQAPLSLENRYWFQVQPSKEQTELKVLEKVVGNSTNSTVIARNSYNPGEQIIQKLGLKSTKANLELTQFFIKNNIPFTRENLQQAGQWIANDVEVSKGLVALKLLITREIPFTYNSFKAMIALQEETPLVSHLSKLYHSLEALQSKSDNTEQLIEKLKLIVAKEVGQGPSQPWNDASNTLKVIKQLMSMLGLQYENDVATSLSKGERQIQNDTLKPLLLLALSEHGQAPFKDGIEHIINRLTGHQLLSLENSQVQQLIFQLPIQLGSILTDLTIQFHGKKRNDGRIDPNYCHMIFNLDLEQLKEITIDVKIQNRVMNIIVFNENTLLEQLIDNLKPSLIAGLERINYKLSGIKVVNPELVTRQKKGKGVIPSKPNFIEFSGVDLRV